MRLQCGAFCGLFQKLLTEATVQWVKLKSSPTALNININMNINEKIYAEIAKLVEDKSVAIDHATPLVGSGSVLDSMKLVELCLSLEDYAGDLKFEFDWTSSAAMSKSRSMFRTAGSLADEFAAQMAAKL